MTSVFGDRGIGKTYHLAQEAYRRYQQGFFIITNFDFAYAHINYSDKSPEQFIELLGEILRFKENRHDAFDIFPSFRHTGIFIAIDEGHLFFSADMWKRYQSDEKFQNIIRVLAQARKLDIEIWYTTQDPAKIDKNWRRYTEEWIKLTPFFAMRKKVNIQHASKPIFKREIRHTFPLLWMEWHKLDADNPVINYATIKDEEGFSHLSEQSTLIRRRLRRCGWLDPFPYKLYDSNEILSVNFGESMEKDYPLLRETTIIPHTFQYERFPTIKKLFRLKRNDAVLPTKFSLESVEFFNQFDVSKKTIKNLQPTATLDSEYIKNERKKAFKEFSKVLSRENALGVFSAVGGGGSNPHPQLDTK